MKKSLSKGALCAAVLLSLAACNLNAMAADFDNAPISSFVKQKGTRLMLDGQEFKLAGSNNYYMHYGSEEMITSVLDDAAALGLNVLRVWGFMDGEHHGHVMQNKPLDYSAPAGLKSSFDVLDFTVSEAKKRGIRLVVALTNNWDDFGGIPQYVKWFNAQDHDDFYTDPLIKNCYKSYVSYLISHVNKYTGIANNQEPTIMTWELCNEPRAASDKSGKKLLAWASEMSEYVHKLAPQQLVALGSEGFFARKGTKDWTYNGNDGVDWDNIIKLPHISYGTFHLYPKTWAKDEAEQWGTAWIKEHARVARKAGKPAVLEEYGIGKDESVSRAFVYRKWTKTAFEEGLNGTMFWILTSKEEGKPDGLYPDYDGFRVLNDGSEVAKILADHARDLRGISHESVNESYVAAPKAGAKLQQKQVTLKVYPLPVKGAKVKQVAALINDNERAVQLTDKDRDGYYAVILDTRGGLRYGENKVLFNTTFDKGEEVQQSLNFELLKPISSYESVAAYTFENGADGFGEGGTYQAEFLKPELEGATLGQERLLKINLRLPGSHDWEELRVKTTVPELAKASAVEFDLYYPADAQGSVRPYVVAGDGWVKMGVDQNNAALSDLEVVNFANTPLRHQHLRVELDDLSGKMGDFYVCLVGNMLPLEGAVYLDNLKFLKPVYEN